MVISGSLPAEVEKDLDKETKGNKQLDHYGFSFNRSVFQVAVIIYVTSIAIQIYLYMNMYTT